MKKKEMVSLKELLKINCVVFAVIFVLHALRVGNEWKLTLGEYTMTQGISLILIIVLGFLFWQNYAHFKKQR